MKSIAQSRKIKQETPNAGSVIHSARKPTVPVQPTTSTATQAQPGILTVELRIVLNIMEDYFLQTYDNAGWKMICQYDLHGTFSVYHVNTHVIHYI